MKKLSFSALMSLNTNWYQASLKNLLAPLPTFSPYAYSSNGLCSGLDSTMLKAVKGVTAAILVLIFIFFVHDIVTNFYKGATTVGVRVEESNSIEAPIIIFCLEPSIKASKMEKYNITKSYFNMALKKIQGISLPDLYNECSYKMNKVRFLT